MAVVGDNQWRVNFEADDPAVAAARKRKLAHPRQSVGPWRAAGRDGERSVVVGLGGYAFSQAQTRANSEAWAVKEDRHGQRSRKGASLSADSSADISPVS